MKVSSKITRLRKKYHPLERNSSVITATFEGHVEVKDVGNRYVLGIFQPSSPETYSELDLTELELTEIMELERNTKRIWEVKIGENKELQILPMKLPMRQEMSWECNVTLAEPFVIGFGEDVIKASFIPSQQFSSHIYQVDARPRHKIIIIHPDMKDASNFKDATTRFYPFITQEKSATWAVFAFQLLKISFVDGIVSIDLVWRSNFFECLSLNIGVNSPSVQTLNDESGITTDEYGIQYFCANRDYAFFTRNDEKSKNTVLYRVEFEHSVIESIKAPFDVEDIFPVGGTLFVTYKIRSRTMVKKINFDNSSKVEKIEEIYVLAPYSKVGSLVGRNLYFGTSRNQSMIFLDRNITKNEEGRKTTLNCEKSKEPGSCLIDVIDRELNMYLDEPTLLQLEIDQCMSSTAIEATSSPFAKYELTDGLHFRNPQLFFEVLLIQQKKRVLGYRTQQVHHRATDASVRLLVEYMLLNKEHHVALNELHHSFETKYWTERLSIAKRSCPVWDFIDTPEQVGLIQFGVLLLRHQNILKRNGHKYSLQHLVFRKIKIA